jgi:hypothetical protein
MLVSISTLRLCLVYRYIQHFSSFLIVSIKSQDFTQFSDSILPAAKLA